MTVRRKILVTGATAYIGGRLVQRLLAKGYDVRVMVAEFSPEYQDRWPNAEIVGADALDCESLAKTMEGVHTAFYLMQSMFVR
ncbi:MAG: NmrA family NAD(P)-binding protein, partial [Verrucomicrobia bacterium]|nr:NmrA family NAD(P)-binding protein [Verrucomicrobiota bacterium]